MKKINLTKKNKPVPNKLKPTTWLMPETPIFSDEDIENLLLDFGPSEEDNKEEEEEIVCECGSDKLGYYAHSHWCAKYE